MSPPSGTLPGGISARAGAAANPSIRAAAENIPNFRIDRFMAPRELGRFIGSEGQANAEAHVATFVEDARIVHRHPVIDVVAVDVLEVGAAGAAGFRVVDE